jgi:outer membrane protein TolC
MSWNLQRFGTDNFGNPLPNPEARLIQSSTSRQVAALRLTVDFRNYLQFRRRGDNALSREITVVNQLQALHANVRRSFLDVQQRQLTVEMETQVLERETANQEAARSLFALARRERIDLLEAELSVAVQEEVIRQSRAALLNAVLELRNVIGDPSLVILEVVPVPLRTFDPVGLDDEALVRVAMTSSPATALQRAQIQAQEGSVRSARAWWLPTLALNVDAGRW